MNYDSQSLKISPLTSTTPAAAFALYLREWCGGSGRPDYTRICRLSEEQARGMVALDIVDDFPTRLAPMLRRRARGSGYVG